MINLNQVFAGLMAIIFLLVGIILSFYITMGLVVDKCETWSAFKYEGVIYTCDSEAAK